MNIRQPKQGYRAATDPVLLAASVDAGAGDAVLELGCGVGVASLCLAIRVSGVKITGLELQSDYAQLAQQNATLNSLEFRVFEGDLTQMPSVLRAESFDHVMINPPFFEDGAVSKPTDAGKALAHVFDASLDAWIDAGLRRLKPNGVLTIIQLAPKLPEILTALTGRAGDIHVLPLASRPGRPAKRVLVKARKGARAPMVLLAPFHIHSGGVHEQGKRDYTDAAGAILRDGAALNWENGG